MCRELHRDIWTGCRRKHARHNGFMWPVSEGAALLEPLLSRRQHPCRGQSSRSHADSHRQASQIRSRFTGGGGGGGREERCWDSCLPVSFPSPGSDREGCCCCHPCCRHLCPPVPHAMPWSPIRPSHPQAPSTGRAEGKTRRSPLPLLSLTSVPAGAAAGDTSRSWTSLCCTGDGRAWIDRWPLAGANQGPLLNPLVRVDRRRRSTEIH